MEEQVPLYKIIRNIASNGAEHAEVIREWLGRSDDNRKIYRDLLNIWQVSGKFPEPFSTDRQKAWQKVRKQIHVQKNTRRLYRKIAQIAAAIIVVFLSIWTGTKLDKPRESGYTEIISPAGQKTHVILPDSSTVLLNGDSRIRYSQDFNEHRIIELQGEGYFDVRKNLSRQFIVNTSELNIKVFGTSFNVKAYRDDQIIEVGLKNGSIGIDRNKKELARMIPGQVATFNKNEKKLDVEKLDMNLVSAWTRDELVFEENSMKEIMKFIERWYGVHIRLDQDLMDGELLTFKVKTESLYELLSLINMLKPIKYQIDGEEVIITKP